MVIRTPSGDPRDVPLDAARRMVRGAPMKSAFRSGRLGAVTVEYALVILIAAAMLVGMEKDVFQPMAKDILKNFMEFIVKPDP